MNTKQPKKKTVITYAGTKAYPEVANGRIAAGQIILEEPESKKARKPRRKK